MTVADATRFEQRAGSEDAVAVRRRDDRGKVDGLAVPDFAHSTDVLESLVAAAS